MSESPFQDSGDEPSLQEKSLQRMEALLQQSAQGIHILFKNSEIAGALAEVKDNKDFFDFAKMKVVQDLMTHLIAKKTYLEKVAFLNDLEIEKFNMLVRTYFHIVENTIRSKPDHRH